LNSGLWSQAVPSNFSRLLARSFFETLITLILSISSVSVLLIR